MSSVNFIMMMFECWILNICFDLSYNIFFQLLNTEKKMLYYTKYFLDKQEIISYGDNKLPYSRDPGYGNLCSP